MVNRFVLTGGTGSVGLVASWLVVAMVFAFPDISIDSINRFLGVALSVNGAFIIAISITTGRVRSSNAGKIYYTPTLTLAYGLSFTVAALFVGSIFLLTPQLIPSPVVLILVFWSWIWATASLIVGIVFAASET